MANKLKSFEENLEDKLTADVPREVVDAKKFENRLTNLEQKLEAVKISLAELSTGVQGLLSKEETRIQPQTIREYGIYFDDNRLYFPHDFVQQFDKFFASMTTCIPEYHKCLIFQGVILTTDNEDWKNSVRGVKEYEVLKKCFFQHYWSWRAQDKAISRCKQDFTRANSMAHDNIINYEILNAMMRWANSLCSFEGRGRDTEYLIGYWPYERYWKKLRKPGQSVDELRNELSKIWNETNPDIVPIQIVPKAHSTHYPYQTSPYQMCNMTTYQ